MDQKGHRGQVLYHMARLGSVDTEQFDISGMREHLTALGAPQELVDYVVEHARADGWGFRRTHEERVRQFLYPERY